MVVNRLEHFRIPNRLSKPPRSKSSKIQRLQLNSQVYSCSVYSQNVNARRFVRYAFVSAVSRHVDKPHPPIESVPTLFQPPRELGRSTTYYLLCFLTSSSDIPLHIHGSSIYRDDGGSNQRMWSEKDDTGAQG